MLTELYVRNFALIRELRTEFAAGLNIITGETGAGKSLLTDAVSLLLAGKGDRELIRRGTDCAVVEGTFTGPFARGVVSFCRDNGIDGFGDNNGGDESQLIITRELTAAGKNTVRINGRRVTLALLERLSPMLMNIHSQTEHFSLFKEEEQLLLLDRFGGAEAKACLEKVALAFSQWQDSHKALTEFHRSLKDREERIEFLKFRRQELKSLNLKPGEKEEIQEELSLLRTASERYETGRGVYDILNGSAESGAVDLLYAAMERIKELSLKDKSLVPLAESLSDAYYGADDVRTEMASYCHNIEADPQRLEELENRYAEIGRGERKYHTDAEGIISLLETTEQELAALEDVDNSLGGFEKAERKAAAHYKEAADELTSLRKSVGESLSQGIIAQLKEMRLKDACFTVALKPASPSPKGLDAVTFMATMNKGEELKPLAKVASGGEISRVLLAAKIMLGRMDDTDTMIFDEIDSGLGGETASRVGEKLQLLASDMQVIAVTHSPLVAAYADKHYYIHKEDKEGRVVVDMELLDESLRPMELARMVSGDAGSAVSLAQAEQLLQQSRRKS